MTRSVRRDAGSAGGLRRVGVEGGRGVGVQMGVRDAAARELGCWRGDGRDGEDEIQAGADAGAVDDRR